MSGLAAIEGELNGAVREYLEYIGFDATLDKFNEECSIKGKALANIDKKSNSNQKVNVILNEMVQLFCQGQRKEFFRRWLQNVPTQLLNDDASSKKLEFELNIHFAIYPLRKGGKDNKAQAEESMNSFRAFIESRGRSLSQTTEFLPYFALPYVPNPQENQGYRQIFSEAWVTDLQRKLESFLISALKSQRSPQLVEAYCQQVSQNSMENTQKLILEAEKRTMSYMKKFNKVQGDYHNLIGITAELVDSLESSIRGQHVTSEYLQNICNRLFSTHINQSIDFTRPGTAGEFIRQSLAYQQSAAALEKERIPYGTLDFEKIKHDLCVTNDRRKGLLLQALRWRLTKSPPGEQREQLLKAYIVNDLLCFKPENSTYNILNLLKSDNEIVRQYMARLLNTMASLNKGRGYLASNIELLRVMQATLRNETEDTLTRQNLLAAMQKLSLRRNLQTVMINEDIIVWLIDLLVDTESMSDYTLEYAVALLMNLCLRSAGKKKCSTDHKKTLKVLSDLLGNSNQEIRPYVNGALYSILSVPSIRDHARVMNLEEILKSYLTDEQSEMNTQLQFIINQINSNEKPPQTAESDNEDDEDDEEDQDVMETDLDKTELLKPAANNELCGENLLITEYGLSHDSALANKRKSTADIHESTVLSRPITPHQLRQSQIHVNNINHFNNNNNNNNSGNNAQNENRVRIIKHTNNNGNNKNDNKKLMESVNSESNFEYLNKSQAVPKVANSPRNQRKAVSSSINRKDKSDILNSTNKKLTNNSASASTSNARIVLNASNNVEKRPPLIPAQSTKLTEDDGSKSNRERLETKIVERSNSIYSNSFVDLSKNEIENPNQFMIRRKSQTNIADHSVPINNNNTKSSILTNNNNNNNNYTSFQSNASIVTTNSFTPKYSTTEPRPSSANSTKSKTSSSSGTANASEYYNSVKKTNGKV